MANVGEDSPSTPQNQRRRTSAPAKHFIHSDLLNPTPLHSPTTLLKHSPFGTTSERGSPLTRSGDSPHRRLSSAAPALPSLSLPTSSPSSSDQAPLNLARLASAVVPSRSGSVLSRGLILKSDYRFVAAQPPASASHSPAQSASSSSSATASSTKNAVTGSLAPSSTPAGPSTDGGFHLSGATNLREGGYGVWGVAQPTATGVRSLLSLLRSRKSGGAKEGREVAWFVTREEPILYIGGQPYVLREAAHPTDTYSISDRAENLEEIEARLKSDVLRESARYDGLVLVHDETRSGSILPTWVSADEVLTARELFSQIRSEGYNVTYFRTPVARDQSPNDGYLDVYTGLLKRIPTSTALVFNCGAGVVRSTFAMSVALIVRRKQLIEKGEEDPYGLVSTRTQQDEGEPMSPRERQNPRSALKVLQAQSEQAARDRSLLRLMHVLSKCLPANSQTTILSLLSTQSTLLENLRSALLGNFDIILSLLSTLDDGVTAKKVVDAIVDHCDAMVNLRESITEYRVRYASLALRDEPTAQDNRQSALAALERYFFLITFASFVSESSSDFDVPFSAWLKRRNEIAKMINRMRKTGTGHFVIFAPIQDLSAIAKGETGEVALSRAVSRGRRVGADLVGDEWAHQIIRNRSGIILRANMILKEDVWLASNTSQTDPSSTSASTSSGSIQHIRGAINFRRVRDSFLYGLSQPTEEGIRRVLDVVKGDVKPGARIVWIGVREEPLCNINGTPYVLRQEAVSLRNVKSYSGISPTRLELLEDRLKADVLSELSTFEGRILVANEADDGSVNPVWEAVEGENQVKTLREVMDAVGKDECGEVFRFIRVPITAEKFPEFSDLRDIIETVTELDMDESAIVVNDQLGRGRTTRTLVIIKLLQDWLRHNGKFVAPRSDRPSYTVINNLLRVVRNGFEIKNAVDAAITACGEPFDLLESIENARQQAEDAEGETRDIWIARGLRELRAYFFLIIFTTFLHESRPETWRDLGRTASYEDFVRSRPVFRTIEKELDHAGIDALVPLKRPIASGTASTDEVADFVAKRNGRILSAYTLCKADYFSGLQKMSLPERVEGAPNFRRVPLTLAGSDAVRTPHPTSSNGGPNVAGATLTGSSPQAGPCVYGSGMPTVDGLRRALEKMDGKGTQILWSSLREEPVAYVAGKPYVLRLFDQPLENVVTTGVTTATVEAMEAELKKDLLREREQTGGKVLLHDEIEENGSFTVTAMWEDVKAEDILTPREVFKIMQDEGFQVDYDRLPVTDEQAPIPGIFSRIEQRVTGALSGRDKEKVGCAWNCQMGRGRTTTGMVACALVYRILFNRQSTFDMSASFIEPPEHGSFWDGREAEPLLNGEYKIVLQLVGVLKNGKLAKRLTDRAIDDMEAVQNLRTAIYSFKLRVEAAEDGSKKRSKLFDQALNYLYRYATLIVFANFLLDKASHLDDTDDEDEATVSFPSFEEYLRERSEIKKILNRRTLD
uniref:BY PROTMAP: gi/472580415/gb/EMS18219.1/ metal ion binding protein [Rhodosporidium toruloides NP11] gi/647403677/emb/CDR49761.1/ RHTO0S32e00298g1_1 [Rhodosporidium toruloides] n=1 Tax=Rhodotorula toruloides TaxID=5286 RepID=A0A0K3CRK6_RHOTO